jgi:hypothetical protein
MPLTLRLDPWTPTYEPALQLDDEETFGADVDPSVETSDWQPLEPVFVERPKSIAFVDGVQRVEYRALAQDEGRTVYAAFASTAVGASIVQDGRCTLQPSDPKRVLGLSDDAEHANVAIPCGTATLNFIAEQTAESGITAPIEAVQEVRRRAETSLGVRLVDEGHEMVVVDGRLQWQPTRKTMVIGLIKTIHKRYLEDAQAAVLPRLTPKTRTPIFRIAREHPVYSWYLRLAGSRPIDHALAGIVRIETPDFISIEAAVHLADLTACHLPGFASSPVHDARAPQNLYPVGGLEQHLRHNLGDPEWIRRNIEAHFAREVAA